MVINKIGKRACSMKLENMTVEQVTHYKYVGSWINENAGCEEDIRARIGMDKAAFWQNKKLMRRNVRFHTKFEDIKLLRVLCSKLWM